MFLNGHAFDFRGHKFLFLFDCPREEHKSRKILHPEPEKMVFENNQFRTKRVNKAVELICRKVKQLPENKVSPQKAVKNEVLI